MVLLPDNRASSGQVPAALEHLLLPPRIPAFSRADLSILAPRAPAHPREELFLWLVETVALQKTTPKWLKGFVGRLLPTSVQPGAGLSCAGLKVSL